MESQRSYKDVMQLFKETDRRMDARLAENERRLAEVRVESERQKRETDRVLAEVGKQIGGLGNRLGDFVEGVVRPGLVRLFRERGLEVRQTLRDLEAKRDGISGQVDLLVVDTDQAVAVEVKSKLATSDVDDHLERLEKFKFLFPQYRETRLLGALAAMVLPDDAVRYAEKRGMFVIGQTGDDAVFLNTPDFQPRIW